MADGIFVAASGAVAQLRHLEIVANNLANSSTAGFQEDIVSFQEVVATRRNGPLEDKRYVQLAASRPRRTDGPLQRTGNPLDVALRGDAFLAVQTPAGVRLTRDGRLTVGADGVLRTETGHTVLDARGGPLRLPPGATPRIAEDGTVGVGGHTIGRLALVRPQPGAPLRKEGGALLRPAGPLQPATARVLQGHIELSNADPVRTMVELVQVQRTFEALHQAIAAYRRMDEHATRLPRA